MHAPSDFSVEGPLHKTLLNSEFCFVLFGIAEIFYINSKNKKKQNNFYFILNLDPFWIFQLNFNWNVSVPFHMFHSALEKPLNQIELV
jgi:hypothetical protein